MKALLIALALVLTGCGTALAPSPDVIKALADSERSWCFSAVTIYGRGAFGGSGVHGGSMTCTLDGMVVKSDAATVGVPMVITPQFSIGAPTLAPR